jgi:hypothetical protein
MGLTQSCHWRGLHGLLANVLHCIIALKECLVATAGHSLHHLIAITDDTDQGLKQQPAAAASAPSSSAAAEVASAGKGITDLFQRLVPGNSRGGHALCGGDGAGYQCLCMLQPWAATSISVS